MQSQLPTWVPILQALLTPTIAIAALLIAGLQVWLAHRRFKFDLFHQRIQVFDATKALVSKVILHGQLSPQEVRDFRLEISNARFLFDKEIESYLDDIWKRALKLEYLDREIERQDNNRKAVDAHEKVAADLRNELLASGEPPLVRRFKPYLKV